MSYGNDKGKYQKAYDFLFAKLVPPSGRALNELGEALRIVNRVYYRLNNDGDSYDDCVDEGMVQDVSKKIYPFAKEYHELGLRLDYLLSSNKYDDAVSLVLVQIMLSLSSESNIYNPETNRLVPINSAAGKKSLKALDLNTVFVNTCGKNAEWLPESLRKAGIKITKQLSEETRKELNCDTIEELHSVKTSPYGRKTSVKVTLSKDNSILSKKFSKIKADHKKSVKLAEKERKASQKRREQYDKKRVKRNVKNFNLTKEFYEELKNLTQSKRLDVVKKMQKSKTTKNAMVQMLLAVLIDYREKKLTKRAQIQNRAEVVGRLTKGLNQAGADVVKSLNYHNETDTYYSVQLNEDLRRKLDDMLVEILGSSEAVDAVYNRVKYN
jgi:hypothetical protein